MVAELVADASAVRAKPHGTIDAAGSTDVGRVRPLNEDAYLIATLQRSMVVHDASPEAARGWLPGSSAGTLLMVADGMGGQGGGEVASRVAVNAVASYLLNVMAWPTAQAGVPAAPESPSSLGVSDQLSCALVVGDSTVKTTAVNTATPRMGTTLTMALVLWPDLYVAHVGDTRCYLWRSGHLRRLTTDHTVAQRVLESATEPVQIASQLHHTLWNSLGGSARDSEARDREARARARRCAHALLRRPHETRDGRRNRGAAFRGRAERNTLRKVGGARQRRRRLRQRDRRGCDRASNVARARGSSGRSLASDHQAIDEQQQHRADHGHQKATEPAVPGYAQEAPDVATDERTENAEHNRGDPTAGLSSGHEKARCHADQKSKQENEQQIHTSPLRTFRAA